MCISGFLFYDKLEKTEESKKKKVLFLHIKRILEIYLLWSILYLIYSISRWDFSNITFKFVISKFQYWVFNSTFSTIWFLPSLAIGIAISFFVTEKFPKWLKYISMIVCFCLGSLTMTYSFVTENIIWFEPINSFINTWLGGSRGGWLFAYPLVTLGGFAAKCFEKFKALKMFVFSLISVICLLAEALVLRKFVGHTGIDILFFIPITVFCILGFLLSIKIPYGSYCGYLRNMSTLIFVSQRLFLTVLPRWLSPVLKPIMPNFMGFIFVCGGTLVFSLLIIFISKKFKFFKKMY